MGFLELGGVHVGQPAVAVGRHGGLEKEVVAEGVAQGQLVVVGAGVDAQRAGGLAFNRHPLAGDDDVPEHEVVGGVLLVAVDLHLAQGRQLAGWGAVVDGLGALRRLVLMLPLGGLGPLRRAVRPHDRARGARQHGHSHARRRAAPSTTTPRRSLRSYVPRSSYDVSVPYGARPLSPPRSTIRGARAFDPRQGPWGSRPAVEQPEVTSLRRFRDSCRRLGPDQRPVALASQHAGVSRG